MYYYNIKCIKRVYAAFCTLLFHSEGSVHEGRKRHIRNLQLIKLKIQTEGGGFDMCKAIKEMLRVSRQEGEQEGRLEGRQEGRLEGRQEGRLEGQDEMATLSEKLILADRISELLKASTDREYRNKLLVEFGLA